jgi:hypothetical protein
VLNKTLQETLDALAEKEGKKGDPSTLKRLYS